MHRFVWAIGVGICGMLLLVGCSWRQVQERVNLPANLGGEHEDSEAVILPPDSEDPSLASGTQPESIGEEDISAPDAEDVLPRTVKALQQEQFSGSNLVFERTETTTNTYTRYRISYLSNGLKISGIMNIPHGEGPFPLVILNHGHIDPSVYTVGRGLKREQDYLARNGYVVLHTDYRNHGLSDKDPELEDKYLFRNYFYSMDAINAILAVKELDDSRIDTEKVAMMGHSMGGGVTMHALIAQPELIDAAILYAPVHSQEYDNMHRWRYRGLSDEQRVRWTELVGDLNVRETFLSYSAATYVTEIQAPMQIYHGTLDDSVPYDRSVETLNLLEQAGKQAELITYQGEGHEFSFKWNDFMAGVVRFLDEQFGG